MAKKAVETKVAEKAPTKVVANDAPKEKTTASKKVGKMRWYVLQSQSNYEKRVQHQVREKVMLQGLEKFIEEVLIPTEEVVEVKKGAKVTSERKFFPGYVLVKANMTDEVWHLLRSTNHVTGFIGAERGSKPLPISQKEADRILHQVQEGVDRPRSLVSFDVGEEVKVVDGPFNTFQGIVEEVDEDKSRLKVSVSIFGRATPIELEFTQVEKC